MKLVGQGRTTLDLAGTGTRQGGLGSWAGRSRQGWPCVDWWWSCGGPRGFFSITFVLLPGCNRDIWPIWILLLPNGGWPRAGPVRSAGPALCRDGYVQFAFVFRSSECYGDGWAKILSLERKKIHLRFPLVEMRGSSPFRLAIDRRNKSATNGLGSHPKYSATQHRKNMPRNRLGFLAMCSSLF